MKISDMPPEQAAKVRQYNREAKREQRKRDRVERDQRILAEGYFRESQKINEEGRKERAALGLCFFAETAPGIDAASIEDALAACREFARALDQPDISDGESLKQFEARIGQVWLEHGGPFLNRSNQELHKGWGDYWPEKKFEEVFKFLPNAAKPIDASTLPTLPSIPKPETTPVVQAPSPLVTADIEAERKVLQQKKTQSVDLGIPVDALRYLNGGKS